MSLERNRQDFFFFVEYTHHNIKDTVMSEENISDYLLPKQLWCPVAGGLRDSAYSGQSCSSIWARGPEANMSGRGY